MSRNAGSQATKAVDKAVEWMVDKLVVAADSGWWAEKLTTLANSAPAYLKGASALAPAPAPAPSYSAPPPPSAPSGVSQADLDAVRDAAAKAESAAQALAGRVADLEDQVRQLHKSQEQLAAHVEEAVGPHEEGAHKAHWWSRLTGSS
jgi:hypothetical protein